MAGGLTGTPMAGPGEALQEEEAGSGGRGGDRGEMGGCGGGHAIGGSWVGSGSGEGGVVAAGVGDDAGEDAEGGRGNGSRARSIAARDGWAVVWTFGGGHMTPSGTPSATVAAICKAAVRARSRQPCRRPRVPPAKRLDSLPGCSISRAFVNETCRCEGKGSTAAAADSAAVEAEVLADVEEVEVAETGNGSTAALLRAASGERSVEAGRTA